MKLITFILPTFNNSNELNLTLTRLANDVDFQAVCECIIIVDDGSNLTSAQEIKDLSNKFGHKLIRLKKNLGKGGAIQEGIMQTQSDFVVYCDSDLPFFMNELVQFSKMLVSREIEILIGDRRKYREHNKQKSGEIRYMLSLLFNKLSHLILGIGKFDNQCGLKGFKKNIAKDLFQSLITKRYSFDAEIIYRAIHRDYSIKTFPIKLGENGKTSINFLSDGFKMAWDLVRIRVYSLSHLKK